MYERLALSKNKKAVKRLPEIGQIVENLTDILKSHYVLEFLNLEKIIFTLKQNWKRP